MLIINTHTQWTPATSRHHPVGRNFPHTPIPHLYSRHRALRTTTTTTTTTTTNNNNSFKMSSTPTLNYFELPGRAEATRVALAYAGKEFDDKRLTFPEYGACKWAGKGLPVLQMDGAEYTQSTALLRYAGKLGGLYPDDALAALKVDEIVMIGEDILANMFKCMGAEDDTVAKGVLEGKVKGLVELLVSKLAANPSSKFFVGTSPTIADLQVLAVIKNAQAGFLTGIPTTLIADTAPTLMEMEAALLEDPKVEAYYASKA